MAQGRGTVTLRLVEEDNARIAAAFIAELVRQGVTFSAEETVGTNLSALGSEMKLVVTFNGGY
jgi:hypothetical protein